MNTTIFIESVITGIPALMGTILLYIILLMLSIISTHVYSKKAMNHIVIESNTSKNILLNDFAFPKRLLRLLLGLILVTGIMVSAWLLAIFIFLDINFFMIVTGGVDVAYSIYIIRQLRNIALFTSLNKNGATGKIIQKYWVSLKVSAFEGIGFGLLFLFIWLVTNKAFFYGGALSGALIFILDIVRYFKQIRHFT